MSLLEKIRVTQTFLESKGIEKPEFGLILGSGLGELADEIQDAIVIDYADIPNWGQSTVVGHAGKLVYGTLSGRKVLALQGRFHFYEGNPLEVVTFPVRVMKAYTPAYREIAHKVADKLGIKLEEGVYLGVTGPTYETPAEIRAFKSLGADAVGMSTVPEVIVAAHSDLKVLGISCISNFAAGLQEELNHEEVVEVTERIKGDFKGLLKAILSKL